MDWKGGAPSKAKHQRRAALRPSTAFPSPTDQPARPLPPPQVAAFVGTHLYDAPSGTLRRAYTNGPSEVAAFADDYAYMVSGKTGLLCASDRRRMLCAAAAATGSGLPAGVSPVLPPYCATLSAAAVHGCGAARVLPAGLLELYFATGDAAHLHWASELQAKMDELFWDEVRAEEKRRVGAWQGPRSCMSAGAGPAQPAAQPAAHPPTRLPTHPPAFPICAGGRSLLQQHSGRPLNQDAAEGGCCCTANAGLHAA